MKPKTTRIEEIKKEIENRKKVNDFISVKYLKKILENLCKSEIKNLNYD